MDKSIVLDIGGAYTKFGYSGESAPRFIIPTDLHPLDLSQYLSSGTPYFNVSSPSTTTTSVKQNKSPNESELKDSLFNFLNNIFFKYLLCKPIEKKIAIVENIYMPRLFRQCLASVLFERFQVNSINYLSPIVSILPILRTTTLLIDIGFRETRILPFYEGIGLVKSFKTITLGHYDICQNLKDNLIKQINNSSNNEQSVVIKTYNKQTMSIEDAKSVIESLTLKQLEDIVVKTLLVAPLDMQLNAVDTIYQLSQDIAINITGEQRLTTTDILFGNPLLSEDTVDSCDRNDLVSVVLDSLLDCDIDIRKSLTHSILLIGGTTLLPGFKRRFIQELKKRLREQQQTVDNNDNNSNSLSKRYANLVGLTNHFEIIKHTFQPNYMMWLGASLAVSIDYALVSSPRVTIDQFSRNGNTKLPEYERMTHSSTALVSPTSVSSLLAAAATSAASNSPISSTIGRK